MQKQRLSFYDAVSVVSQHRSKIAPNSYIILITTINFSRGFVQQLKLFESLEYDLSEPQVTCSPLRKASYLEYVTLNKKVELKKLFKEWEGNLMF
jgi:hypothetical protein